MTGWVWAGPSMPHREDAWEFTPYTARLEAMAKIDGERGKRCQWWFEEEQRFCNAYAASGQQWCIGHRTKWAWLAHDFTVRLHGGEPAPRPRGKQNRKDCLPPPPPAKDPRTRRKRIKPYKPSLNETARRKEKARVAELQRLDREFDEA